MQFSLTYDLEFERKSRAINVFDTCLMSCIMYRCSYDYLNVYDGSNTGAKLIDKFCGHQSLNILSSGQNLYLEFITDDSERLRGFELSYKFVYASGKCQIVRIKYQYMTKRLLYTLKLIEKLSLRNVWMIFIWLRYLRGEGFPVP